MANYDLGTAHGKVQIDYDAGPLKKTKQDLDDVKGKGTSAGAALKKTGDAMGVAGLAVTAGIGLAIKATANFEKSISGIGAVTGATGGQLDQVRTKALQLGRDTAFSASQAADAMGELAKAGISLPDIMNGAADATVALAAAGGIALPDAARIASNAMNQFALKAQEMPKVADLIAGAANASAIDVHDFGMSLSQVGAVAHSMGLSLDDTAAAIAVLGNAGIKGSDAGTSLKQMLISLANPTSKARDLMEQLGFAAFDSQGKLKPLDQIAGGLQNSMKNLTPEARNAALSIIFGSDAARAGAVFFQNGASGVDKMSAAMAKIKAADVAKARMNNLSGSVEQLKGSIETAAIKFGEMGQGPMKSLVDSITKLINAFTNLSNGTQQTILVMVASLGGLALFGAGLIKTVRGVQELIAVLKVLKVTSALSAVFSALSAGVGILNGSLLTLAANPVVITIILIVAAVALLIAGIILLWRHSETFRSIVIGAWRGIQAVIKAVVAVCITAFHGLQKGFDGLMVGVRAVKTAWDAVWGFMAPIVRVTFRVIAAIIRVVFAIIKGAVLAGLAVLKTAWNVWLFFAPIVQAAMNLIIAIIRLAIAIIKLIIIVILVALKIAWEVFWTGLTTAVKFAWKLVTAIIRTAINFIVSQFKNGVALWRAIINGVVKAIHALINTWIGQKIVAVIRGAVNVIKSIWNGLVSLATTVGRFFVAVYNAIRNPVAKALSYIGGIGGKIVGYFKNAGKWLLNAGKNIILGLINGITSKINALRGFLGDITNKIKSWKGPPAKDAILLVDNGADIMQSLMDGIAARVPELEAMLGKIGPGNIAQAVSRNETINAAVGATAGATSSRTAIATSPAIASGSTALTIDHAALVQALKAAGVGEMTVELDGEKISRNSERSSGRRTAQRRRVQ